MVTIPFALTSVKVLLSADEEDDNEDDDIDKLLVNNG